MNEDVKKIVDSIVKVENYPSLSWKGNGTIPNQFIIYGTGWKLFQSYDSPIALIKDYKTYIFRDWDYSTTTGKYRNDFLGEKKAETLKKLKSGEYIAVDFEV
jgi:hypothetical protein